jgi:hypothetical protein
MVISLAYTIESWCGLDMLFLSHSSTNRPEGLERKQSVWQKSSSTISWKIKGNTPTKQFWLPADLSLFHHWIMSIFGYTVHLDVSFILNGEDRKHTLWQCVVHVEQ